MKPVRKAVLPVAGFGTRVLPATKAVPKEMLTVFDRPALQYVVDEAREAGIEHFVFVTGRGKQAIEDYFDKAYELEATLEAKKKDAILAEVQAASLPPGASSFTRQQAALGLGHAVLCARDIVGEEPFAVLLPDVIVKGQGGSCLKQMVDAYNEVGGNIIAVDEVPQERVNQYGVIVVNPARHPHVKLKQAQAFADWIVSSEGQQAIADYRIGGEALFFPNAKR